MSIDVVSPMSTAVANFVGIRHCKNAFGEAIAVGVGAFDNGGTGAILLLEETMFLIKKLYAHECLPESGDAACAKQSRNSL